MRAAFFFLAFISFSRIEAVTLTGAIKYLTCGRPVSSTTKAPTTAPVDSFEAPVDMHPLFAFVEEDASWHANQPSVILTEEQQMSLGVESNGVEGQVFVDFGKSGTFAWVSNGMAARGNPPLKSPDHVRLSPNLANDLGITDSQGRLLVKGELRVTVSRKTAVRHN